MESCGLDQNAAYFANLPAFISEGPFQGSMFTHALSNLPDLLEVTEDIFSSMEKNGQNVEKTSKALDAKLQATKQSIQNANNFMESHFYKKRLLIYDKVLYQLDEIRLQYEKVTGLSCLPPAKFFKENQMALMLSFVSSIYLNLWTAPRQIFPPMTSVCSGAWPLWNSIDTTQMAERLWSDVGKDDFCSNLFEESHWLEQLNGISILKAIIIRMGEMGSPPISYSIVDWHIRILLRYLGVNDYIKVDTELNFLKNHEHRLEALFQEVFKKQ